MTVELVELTAFEAAAAAFIGQQRQLQSVLRGLQHAHGFDGRGEWDAHIEGAAAEMAVAKYLGIYWDFSVGTFKLPDLGHRLQVRNTASYDNRLIVRPDAKENEIYIRVMGKIPQFRIVGWIRADRAKHPAWLSSGNDRKKNNNRPPAYFVPDTALRPIELLRFRLHQHIAEFQKVWEGTGEDEVS